MPNQPFLCLDIGGTKCVVGGFYPRLRPLRPTPLFIKSLPTKKGRNNLRETLKTLLNSVADHGPFLPIVSIGIPGKFNDSFRIVPGSAENLGETAGEFDHLDIRSYLAPLFPKGTRVIVRNDALCQCAGGILECWQKSGFRKAIKNDGRVIYVGPGTGLGGAVAIINPPLVISFKTDGHIYDILIHSSPKKTRKFPAEDIISGRSFLTNNGVSSKEVNESESLFNQYKNEINNLAVALCHLIQTLNSGNIKKQNQDYQWPKEDIELVKGTQTFILGGSLTRPGRFGNAIFYRIKKIFATQFKQRFNLFRLQDGGKAALLGSFYFAKRATENFTKIK